MSQSSQALPLTAAPAAREKNRTLAGWPVLGEALKMAAGAVWTHKLRSFLTLIGVIIGVASVMVVGAIISGLETYVTDNITSALGSNSFIIDRVARVNMTHEEYDKIYRKHKDLTWDDYQAILQKSKLAKAVVIQKGRPGTSRGNSSTPASPAPARTLWRLPAWTSSAAVSSRVSRWTGPRR